MTYDLAIIGGGPAGYTAAEKAARAGLKTILFEQNELGGVCLQEGCIPTKTLLNCAKIYHKAKDSDTFGVNAQNVSASLEKMQGRKTRVLRRLTAGIKARLRDSGVEVIKARAEVISNGIIKVQEDTFEYKNLLLCTGSHTAVPPIPGINEKVLTSKELLNLTEIPEALTIIGGGVIGMEFASLFNELGTKVTVIEMLPEILGATDKQISAMLREIYTKRGIEFHLGCKVLSIEGSNVVYSDPEQQQKTAESDLILLCVGRRPNIEGLEVLGLNVDKGVVTDNQMRTSVPGVYAAGDINGKSMLAHTAEREAAVAVNTILGIEDEMSYDAIPGVVYTTPEVAGVGVTQETAPEGSVIKTLPMAYAGRYVAENEDITGMCKIITNPNGKVIGVHMIGSPCSEIIGAACIAVETQMNVKDLERVVFPHPSVSEIIKETINTL